MHSETAAPWGGGTQAVERGCSTLTAPVSVTAAQGDCPKGEAIFGKWVRQVRERMGMTQHSVAQSLGIHWTTLSRWERGLVQPSLDELVKIAGLYTAYAVDLDAWLPTKRIRQLEGPGKLGYFGDHGTPALKDYVQHALRRGEKLMLAHNPALPLLHALAALTGNARAWTAAVGDGQIEGVPLDRLFGDGAFELNPARLLQGALALDAPAHRAGYPWVRWMVDFHPLLPDGKLFRAFVVLERMVDAVFNSRALDQGLGVYPRHVLQDPHAPVLLSLQPRLVVDGGVVENPFYDDPLLALSVRLIRAAAHGERDSRPPPTART